MMEWRTIDSAPRDGTRVLVVDSKGNIDCAKYEPDSYEYEQFVRTAKDGNVYRTVKEECGWWDSGISIAPTHWMPLPEPPKDAK